MRAVPAQLWPLTQLAGATPQLPLWMHEELKFRTLGSIDRADVFDEPAVADSNSTRVPLCSGALNPS